MATLTTLVDGQVAVVAPVNANFAALNSEIAAQWRTLYSVVGTFRNSVLTEEVLVTYTMPANTITAAGEGLTMRGVGLTAGNANTKTLKLYVGASAALVLNPTTTAPNNRGFSFDIRLVQLLAGSSYWDGYSILSTSTGVTPALEIGGRVSNESMGPLTVPIVIKITATCPTAPLDVTLNTFTVGVFRNPS